MAVLDRRLFLFAYYEPKPFAREECGKLQFYTAVINLYGLFYECGPAALQALDEKVFLAGLGMDSGKRQRHKECIRNYNYLCRSLNGIRNAFCHNNYDGYFVAAENNERKHDFFYNLGMRGEPQSQAQWCECLNKLRDLADRIIKDIAYFLGLISQLPDSWKLACVDYWVLCTINWYIKKGAAGMEGWLKDQHSYYCTARNMYGPKRPRFDIWLDGAFPGKTLETWFNEDSITCLLKSEKDCPTPAMPLDVYSKLGKAVRTYAYR